MSSAQAGRRRSKVKKNSKKETIPVSEYRTEIVRYPHGLITTWGGVFIDPHIREHFRVGNIVRVPLRGLDGGSQAPYFRIIQDLGEGKFRGRCEDPYLSPDMTFIQNGETRVFSRRHPMELPLQWDGNENLREHAKLRPVARSVTGVVM